MPSEHSEPQRTPAWPEVPPAWPEVPAASSFTPSARSFEAADQGGDQPPRHTGQQPAPGPSRGPSHGGDERTAFPPPPSYGDSRADDPYGMPQSSQHATGPNPFLPPPPASYGSDPLGVRPEPPRQDSVWPEPARQDSVWGEPPRQEPPRREPARQESVWPEPGRPEPVRQDSVWPEPARQDSVWGEPSRAESARQGSVWPEPSADSTRTDGMRSDPLRADPLRDDPLGMRPDPARPGSSRQDRIDPLGMDPRASDPLRPDPLRADPLGQGSPGRPDPLGTDRPAFGDATMSLPTPSAPAPDATMSMPAPANPDSTMSMPAPGGAYPQAGGPPGQQAPGQHGGAQPGFPGPGGPHDRPQEGMGRQDDPYRPFVTAGQISGPKTPPAHRQEELWNTVFGPEGERDPDDGYYDDEGGRPIWLFALIGSVIVALIAALVWAFVSGPLSSDDGADDVTPSAKPSAKNSAPAAAKPQSLPALPTYEGTASPVSGTVTDSAGRITLPKLGGPWQLDQRAQHIQDTYGFATRQYVAAGTTPEGKPQFAQVMTGPLDKSLAAKYTAGGDLGPVINSVMFQARQKLFDKGNKAAPAARQRVSRGGMTGQLVAYTVKTGSERTTAVVAALDAGGDVPTIVYMQVPKQKDELLPDINTVFKRIRPVG
ncbi:hypothetical protein [Microtetraspora niveoalba]|uniref:hypothetical protein n=1 Tax=Microtetraspora niveoalba TaxID=46175 RepID=UPI000AA7159E|nr:hypothetical protein [Microtetraspora niveoalba]